MFVLTFSPLGEKVNTNMALIHRQVKKSTLGKIANNHHPLTLLSALIVQVEAANSKSRGARSRD